MISENIFETETELIPEVKYHCYEIANKCEVARQRVLYTFHFCISTSTS